MVSVSVGAGKSTGQVLPFSAAFMPRYMQHGDRQRANGETVTIGKQPVEVGTVAAKVLPGIEQLAKGLLHLGDVRADRYLPTQLLLQIGRSGRVMGMGFQQPVDAKIRLCVRSMEAIMGESDDRAAALEAVLSPAAA